MEGTVDVRESDREAVRTEFGLRRARRVSCADGRRTDSAVPTSLMGMHVRGFSPISQISSASAIVMINFRVLRSEPPQYHSEQSPSQHNKRARPHPFPAVFQGRQTAVSGWSGDSRFAGGIADRRELQRPSSCTVRLHDRANIKQVLYIRAASARNPVLSP